jgi:hypothetical protein
MPNGRRQANAVRPANRDQMATQDRAKSSQPLSRNAPVAFLALVLLLTALVAAAAAHSLIDIIGDYALPHDSYDGMAHHARTLAFVVVLIFAIGGVLRLLWSAIDAGHASTGTFRELVRPVLALPVWRFAAAITIVALLTVVAMESVDSLLDGVRIDDFADVLGGSIPLGMAVTLTISIFIGAAVSHLFRAIAAAHRTIVEIVHALFVGTGRRAGSQRAARTALLLESFSSPNSPLSTRTGKRAPPPLLV